VVVKSRKKMGSSEANNVTNVLFSQRLCHNHSPTFVITVLKRKIEFGLKSRLFKTAKSQNPQD
jgi:hypothetical protein